MFNLAQITPQIGTEGLFWPLVYRGGVTVLMFLPLSLATLGGLPQSEISAGSSFYNLTRQLGGSIGIAILTTLLAQREAFHSAILSAKLTPYDLPTMQRLNALKELFQSRGSDGVTAQQQALASLQQLVTTQSAVLSYADIFRFVGIVFLCSLPLLFFLGAPASKGGQAGSLPPSHG